VPAGLSTGVHAADPRSPSVLSTPPPSVPGPDARRGAGRWCAAGCPPSRRRTWWASPRPLQTRALHPLQGSGHVQGKVAAITLAIGDGANDVGMIRKVRRRPPPSPSPQARATPGAFSEWLGLRPNRTSMGIRRGLGIREIVGICRNPFSTQAEPECLSVICIFCFSRCAFPGSLKRGACLSRVKFESIGRGGFANMQQNPLNKFRLKN